MAQALGIWQGGAGGFRRNLDSVLHVLPAGERFFRHGAGRAVAGTDESLLAHGTELHRALHSFFALRGAGLPRAGYLQRRTAGSKNYSAVRDRRWRLLGDPHSIQGSGISPAL